MPVTESRPRWGDSEDEDGGLPLSVVVPAQNGIKKVAENPRNPEVGVSKMKVRPAVVKRKEWAKYGDSVNDTPGPNSSTTVVAEDVFLTLTSQSQMLEVMDSPDDPLTKLANASKGGMCRTCKGDHWTRACPYKDTLGMPDESLDTADTKLADASTPAAGAGSSAKYVPPSMRDGGNRRGESMKQRQVDDAATVRVTNLSEDCREGDLQELFKRFGVIQRIFLAKDKITQQSKGFAFISYLRKEDAASAISALCGYGYDHLILQVEWAKPPSTPGGP